MTISRDNKRIDANNLEHSILNLENKKEEQPLSSLNYFENLVFLTKDDIAAIMSRLKSMDIPFKNKILIKEAVIDYYINTSVDKRDYFTKQEVIGYFRKKITSIKEKLRYVSQMVLKKCEFISFHKNRLYEKGKIEDIVNEINENPKLINMSNQPKRKPLEYDESYDYLKKRFSVLFDEKDLSDIVLRFMSRDVNKDMKTLMGTAYTHYKSKNPQDRDYLTMQEIRGFTLNKKVEENLRQKIKRLMDGDDVINFVGLMKLIKKSRFEEEVGISYEEYIKNGRGKKHKPRIYKKRGPYKPRSAKPKVVIENGESHIVDNDLYLEYKNFLGEKMSFLLNEEHKKLLSLFKTNLERGEYKRRAWKRFSSVTSELIAKIYIEDRTFILSSEAEKYIRHELGYKDRFDEKNTREITKNVSPLYSDKKIEIYSKSSLEEAIKRLPKHQTPAQNNERSKIERSNPHPENIEDLLGDETTIEENLNTPPKSNRYAPPPINSSETIKEFLKANTVDVKELMKERFGNKRPRSACDVALVLYKARDGKPLLSKDLTEAVKMYFPRVEEISNTEIGRLAAIYSAYVNLKRLGYETISEDLVIKISEVKEAEKYYAKKNISCQGQWGYKALFLFEKPFIDKFFTKTKEDLRKKTPLS
jgi:hypothetical protein